MTSLLSVRSKRCLLLAPLLLSLACKALGAHISLPHTASPPSAPVATLAPLELPSPTSPSASRPDGAIRLTTPPHPASDQNPAFSPDGTRLVFTRFAEGYNDGPAGLFLLDIDSLSVVPLTPQEDQDNVNLPGSTWNATNQRIVFASDCMDADEIWRIAPDGSDFTRITYHESPTWYIEPTWSPDGEWIAFELALALPDDRQQGSIWKVRSDGTGLTQLTDAPAHGLDDRQPNWSPTGDRILFQRRIVGNDDWNLFIMAPDGSALRQVTNSPSSDTDASWSPDGRWIVYSSDHGGLEVANLYVISAQGGDSIRVTRDIYEDSAPSWSPDRRWIAFESHQGRQVDSPTSLWRIPVPDFASFKINRCLFCGFAGGLSFSLLPFGGGVGDDALPQN